MNDPKIAGACVLLMLLAACGNDDEGQVALGTLERDRLELVAESAEPLVEVRVTEGQRVTQGQVLVRLDDAAHAARVAAAQAEVDAARNRLAELVSGPRGEEILEARARAEGAQSAAQSETRELQRIAELVARELTSQSSLDRQRAVRDRAVAAHREAQARLKLLLRGTRIEELDQARDALRRAEAQLSQTRVSHDRLTVVAPRTGTIEALPFELGERPPAGSPVVVMLADGTTYARVHVPGAIRTRIMPGAPAEVRVEGFDQSFPARVRYIASQAAFTPYYALTQRDRGRLSYLAEVTLEGAAAQRLPVGIPVEVRFPDTAATAQR